MEKVVEVVGADGVVEACTRLARPTWTSTYLAHSQDGLRGEYALSICRRLEGGRNAGGG